MKKITGFILPAAGLLLLLSLSGCASLENKEGQITVEGTGTVTAVPDTVSLSISINELAETTKAAQLSVNTKVERILTLLEAAGVEERNIRTAAINFNPEYSWNDGVQNLVGQRANQTIVFQIEEIGGHTGMVTDLLDELASVDGIRLQQMLFDIKDETALYSDSRELAYQKALMKAREYASFAGMEIGTVLAIYESTSPGYPSPVANRMLLEAAAPAGAGGSTSLPTGEIEVTTEITVIFRLK